MSYESESKVAQSSVKLMFTFSLALTIFFSASILIYTLVQLVELMSIQWLLIGFMISALSSISVFKFYANNYILPGLEKLKNKEIPNDTSASPPTED